MKMVVAMFLIASSAMAFASESDAEITKKQFLRGMPVVICDYGNINSRIQRVAEEMAFTILGSPTLTMSSNGLAQSVCVVIKRI